MLRISAIGSFRLGMVAAAALMVGGLCADVAEAKRGVAIAKSVVRGLKSDSDKNDAQAASEDGAATANVGSGDNSTGEDARDGEMAKQAKAGEPPAVANPEPIDKDYYGKRADGILKQEDGVVNAKPHPLAAAHPGMDVVVCEGGCNEVPAEIVFMRPTTYKPKTAEQLAAEKAAKSADRKGPKVVAPSAPGTPASKDIVCLGGCYDTPALYAAAASRDAHPVALGEWMTSVTPTSAMPAPAKPGSGDWMRKIDKARE